MKALIFSTLLLLSTTLLNAQAVSDIRPPENGKTGEYTEWKSVEVLFADGSKATIEYRTVLQKRIGIACHYRVEVKNTSDIKLSVKMKASYKDKLVKRDYSDEAKGSVKPGNSIESSFIAQGCKKEKGSETDDYGHCFACEFGINIYVSK
jgi:hypothetical protein